MTQLILTEEQARLFRDAKGPVQICDPAGEVLVLTRPAVPLDQLDPVDRKAVEDYLRRRYEPKERSYSSQHVQAMLQALEREWERTGGFDAAYMHKFIEVFRPEDAR